LDENISEHHLVRIINKVVDGMDISELLRGYAGGGASAYHPRMLLKVLLYAYCRKLYSGRKIAEALCSDICFMWLSGKQYPDFRTLNGFRSGRLKKSMEEIFKSLLLFMFKEGYIRLEEYYCDGTILHADANKHKITWKKNIERMKEKITSRIEDTLKEIDELNRPEDNLYGEDDLPEKGKADASREERIADAIKQLNGILSADKDKDNDKDKDKKKQAREMHNSLIEDCLRLRIYEEKEAQCGERSGYSSTDVDASPMRTKECEDDLRPAYNGIIGSEEQYITGVSVHQNPNDGTCFKQHMQEVLPLLPCLPDVVVADAAFGTEENDQYMDDKDRPDGLLKYPSYDKEQTKSVKENIFHKDNMPYDAESDSFLCPNKKRIIFKEIQETKNKNGFISTIRRYECEDCSLCPFFDQCGSGQREEGNNRQIGVNENPEHYKEVFRQKLQSPEGRRRMKQRGHDVETCFGDTKANQLFRRVHLRGLAKVKTEWMVIAMAHNLRKMQIKIQKETV
jgi:transposase